MVKIYKLDERPCEFGHEKKAFYVNGHSTLEAIVCYTYDANASDAYANIARWFSNCSIKVKGEEGWRHYHTEGKILDVEFDYRGQQIAEKINPGSGLHSVLAQLELPSVRQKQEKKERLSDIDAEIKDLRREKRRLAKKD